ncbi:MAG: ankyrin repeat domain-containing protein [Legionella sp.]|nr:ankyrin repeat domain-containing protein [Legionella sp.]
MTVSQSDLLNALPFTLGEDASARPEKARDFLALWHAADSNTRLSQDDEGNSVLHFIALYGYDDLIQTVLNDEPELAEKKRTYTDEYPIHLAVSNAIFEEHGDSGLAVIKKLYACDPNTATHQNSDDQTALHYAVRYGSAKMVKYCCEHLGQANIDEKDTEGMTALAWAESKPAMKAYLIGQGAKEAEVDFRAQTQMRL